jgi:hypothetical protein
MQRILNVFILVIFMIMISAIVSPLKADVRDLYCFLESITQDVAVKVWEEDRQGNKGPLIWQGIVKQGKRQRVNTRTGNIRVSTNAYVGQSNAYSGDKSRWCEAGSTIGVP